MDEFAARLLERDQGLERIAVALERAWNGVGMPVLIEGPPDGDTDGFVPAWLRQAAGRD